MTTATTPRPDIPLPDGTYVLCDWAETDNEYRVISSYSQRVDATENLVSGVATQLRNGSINNAADDWDVPLVFVDALDKNGTSCERLLISVEGARNLARAITVAADRIEQWTAAANSSEVAAR